MKKYKSIILFVSFLFLIGCSSEDDTFTEHKASVSDKFETKIQFISSLKDKSLISTSADFDPLDSFIKKTINEDNNFWLTVLDRADNTQLSRIMTIPMNTNKWSSFAFNRLKSKDIYEGSMLLYNEPTRSLETHFVNSSCYIAGFSPKMKGVRTDKDETGQIIEKVDVSFNVNFYTGRFEDISQIDAFGGENGVMNTIKRKNMNLLMIGTVKNSLFDTLQTKVSDTDNTFKVVSIEVGSDYTIFMLSEERFWGYRDLIKTTLVSDISVYEISLMW